MFEYILACKIYKDLPVAMSYNVLSGSPVSMGEFPWMVNFFRIFYLFKFLWDILLIPKHQCILFA